MLFNLQFGNNVFHQCSYKIPHSFALTVVLTSLSPCECADADGG